MTLTLETPVRRTRYFKTVAQQTKLRRLLEIDCMTIDEAAEEMKIPEYVVLSAATRYGMTFHKRRTYWTEEENTTLIRLFRQFESALPNKTKQQIIYRLATIYIKGLRGRN